MHTVDILPVTFLLRENKYRALMSELSLARENKVSYVLFVIEIGSVQCDYLKRDCVLSL